VKSRAENLGLPIGAHWESAWLLAVNPASTPLRIDNDAFELRDCYASTRHIAGKLFEGQNG
jgi:hypothetical protein